ncbi:MAG TPA: ATP-binding protein [Vicinamibacterales bacterium]
MDSAPTLPPTPQLANFIRQSKDAILQRWEQHVRRDPKAANVSCGRLRNSMPRMLDELALETDRAADERVFDDYAIEHAMSRLDLGFSVDELVREYGLLRDAIWAEVDLAGVDLTPKDVALIDGVLDRTIERAVMSYASAQQRTLMALNRISEVAVATGDIDRLLQRLAEVFESTAEGVDAVEILLCEGSRLMPRAATGVGGRLPGPTALAERVVTTKHAAVAVIDGDGADDQMLRARQLKTMYAVPLTLGASIIGVAQMGSRHAFNFGEEQRLLLRVLAERAANLIDRARSLAQGRADAAVMRALASATSVDDAIVSLLSTIGEQFDWETGAFWARDSKQERLTFHQSWTAPGGDFTAFWATGARQTFANGAGLPGRAWAAGDVEWLPVIAEDATFHRRAAADAAGLMSGLAFPLFEETGGLLGVLEFFSRRSRAHDEAAHLTRVLARQLPEFIRRISVSQRVQRSEAASSAMQAVALDAIIWMDHQGIVTGWNPAAVRTFGFEARDAIGRPLAELIIPERFRAAHQAGIARYLQRGRGEYLDRRLELPAIDARGGELTIELTITAVQEDGRPLFCGFARDITGKKALEAERERLLAEATHATQTRDQLLAVVSHDLRNALHTISLSGAAVQAALSRPAGPDGSAARSVDVIVRAANQMRQLTGDLLDVAAMRSGHLSIRRSRENLSMLLHEAVEQHRGLAEEKSLALAAADVAEDVWVDADKGRLMQVLGNLLGNAIKFGRPGDRIDVSTRVDNGSVSVAVRDTAPGIPPGALPFVFEPHWAGDAPGKGTGLGLFIARRLVEAHGGTIGVESAPGSGSTFTFRLPLA